MSEADTSYGTRRIFVKLTEGSEPRHAATVIAKLTLDRSGRVSLPKSLREEMRLAPGDSLHLESEGERITLRPLRPQARLKKERGIWVYQGEATEASIPELIDRGRDKRLRGPMRRENSSTRKSRSRQVELATGVESSTK